MLFFIPTGTDVPIYHWPLATGGLTILNVLVFVLQSIFPQEAQWFILEFGVLNPLTWFSAMLMHTGIGHLLGNLIGFALLGWIIEGKVGWWRFTLICLSIGATANAITQAIMLGASTGGVVGFSGVVFGLIAMTMVWAPENEMRMTCFGIVFIRPFAFHFDITLSTLGFVLIGMELLIAAFSGFQMSTEVIHLIGAVTGFVLAVLMLKWRWVDCDGYDLISTMKGQRGKRVRTIADEKARQVRIEKVKTVARREKERGLSMVENYVKQGHYDLAVNRFNLLKKNDHSLVMTEDQLVTLIQAYDADESTKLNTIPLLTAYLEHYDRHRIPFTLMLARIHVLMQDRPRQGVKVLKTLTWEDLNRKQKDFVRRLLDRAKQMIADGVLEVDEET